MPEKAEPSSAQNRDGYETHAETEPNAGECRCPGHAGVDKPYCHTETDEEAFVRIHELLPPYVAFTGTRKGALGERSSLHPFMATIES